MAVKVLDKAKMVTKTVVCPACFYKLAYTIEDVQQAYHTDYSGETDAWFYIICPKDNSKIEVLRWEGKKYDN